MKVRMLTDAAYADLSKGREQVLTKKRGYGVISIQVNNLTFAVPLRSNMNKNSFGLKTILVGKSWNGIDYSKALVIEDGHLEPEAFKFRDNREYEKLQKSAEKIQIGFSEYVEEYRNSILNNIPLKFKFKFTTLQYFHKELGI